jgi:hypothetical protein
MGMTIHRRPRLVIIITVTVLRLLEASRLELSGD